MKPTVNAQNKQFFYLDITGTLDFVINKMFFLLSQIFNTEYSKVVLCNIVTLATILKEKITLYLQFITFFRSAFHSLFSTLDFEILIFLNKNTFVTAGESRT